MARYPNSSTPWITKSTVANWSGIIGAIILISTGITFNIRWVLKERLYLDSELTDHEVHSDKWIVITTIQNVTDSIRSLATLEGWKIVVIGDQKRPSSWRYPNCTFLNVPSQYALGYEVTSHLPMNSYSRKTIGYLYAIQHGAKFVYDTDDDNRPIQDHLSFQFGTSSSGIRAESVGDPYPGFEVESTSDKKSRKWIPEKSIFWNPYPHFGQSGIWPRGYPLEMINQDNHRVQLRLYDRLKPSAIQQGLVNHDPDVDAIYRLINYPNTKGRSILFDPVAPPVQLGPGIYSPFNSQNTLFRYEAFWTLYLPTTVSPRVSDIWRGYWCSKILNEIGGSVTFYPPNAVQIRNAHNYFRDFLEEQALYKQAASLVQLVHSWTCGDDSVPECALGLARLMADHGYWSMEDVTGIEAWFGDLQRIGYVFPVVQKNGRNEEFRGIVSYVSSQNDGAAVQHGTTVSKNGNPGSRSVSNGNPGSSTIGPTSKNSIPITKHGDPDPKHGNSVFKHAGPDVDYIHYKHIKELLRFCNVSLITAFRNIDMAEFPSSWRHQLRRLALIVVIRRPVEQIIRLYRILYDPWFANTLFCTSVPQLGPESSTYGEPFSYIHLNESQGVNEYGCLSRAMELGMNVDGYMVLKEMALYNIWDQFDVRHLHAAYSRSDHTIVPSSYNAPCKVHRPDDTDLMMNQGNAGRKKGKRKGGRKKERPCIGAAYYVPDQLKMHYIAIKRLFGRNESSKDALLHNANRPTWNMDENDRRPRRSRWKPDRRIHSLNISILDDTNWRKEFCDGYANRWLRVMHGTIDT